MKRRTVIVTVILAGLIPVITGRSVADTLFLRDGSILNGTIVETTPDEITFVHRVLGDLTLLPADILYQHRWDARVYTEFHAITHEGLSVLTQLKRPVPPHKGQAERFNL